MQQQQSGIAVLKNCHGIGARRFGKEDVLNFLNDLLPDIEDEETIKCVKALLFWCSGFEQQCT